MKFLLILIATLYSPLNLLTQNYHLEHITKEQGLPSNQTTSIIQDKKGYIWIGTMNGAVRYDGKYLKKFTVADGLTSNEVQGFFEDPIGRIWINCFGGKSCYYLNGVIYNIENDIRLKSIDNFNFSTYFHKNKSQLRYIFDVGQLKSRYFKEILFDFEKLSFKITDSLSISKIDSLHSKTKKLLGSVYSMGIIYEHFFKYNFCLINGFTNEDKYRVISAINIYGEILNIYTKDNWHFIINLKEKKLIIKYKKEKNNFNTYEGNKIYSYKDSQLIINDFSKKDTIVLNQKFNSCFMSKDNIVWVASNNGVYVFIKDNLEKTSLKINIPINCIKKINNYIYMGCELNQVYNYTNKTRYSCQDLNIGSNRVLDFYYFNKSVYTIGDYGSFNLCSCFKNKAIIAASKNIIQLTKFKFIYSNAHGLFLLNLKYNKYSNDKVFASRVFNSFVSKDSTVYISTLNGILYKNINSTIFKPLKLPFKNIDHISHIQEDKNQNLILSTNKGLIIKTTQNNFFLIDNKKGLADNQIYKTIPSPDKLQLNICTNNGYNRLKYQIVGDKIHYSFKTYTTSDGLPSNEIYSVLEDNDKIYIGTSEGLAILSSKDSIKKHKISIILESMSVNDSIYFQLKKNLQNFENSIQFRFSAFYYQRSKEMIFSYQLYPIHNKPLISEKSEINFQGLQPDNYKLKIYAFDKHYPQIKSDIYTYHFTITPPFYQTWWFYLLGLFALGFISYIYYKRKLKRIQQINLYEKKFSQLKLEALKAEMNPHFIFNCLSAIKDYILKADIEKSQYYLSKLAKLIRLALYNSKDEFVKLSDEISFIDIYIELERMRFDNQFDFIKYFNTDNFNHIQIPTMILQPFFENAIRHGKIGQLEIQGKLYFNVFEENNILVFDIRDNGIGIDAAQKQKESSSDDHRSLAIDIINERIEIYNHSYNLEIKYKMNTLENNEYKTQVLVYLNLKNL